MSAVMVRVGEGGGGRGEEGTCGWSGGSVKGGRRAR